MKKKKKIKKKSIYVVLTMTGTLPARIIKFYTGEPYSHASIAFDEDLKEMYSFARRTVHNPLNAGFVREYIDSGIFGIYKEITTCSIYKMSVTEEQYNKIRAGVEEFKKNPMEYSYNYIGIVGCMLHMPINRSKKYICSQFVAQMLEESGIKMFNKNYALVRPRDIRNCPKLHKIYEGKLVEYRQFIRENSNELFGDISKEIQL